MGHLVDLTRPLAYVRRDAEYRSEMRERVSSGSFSVDGVDLEAEWAMQDALRAKRAGDLGEAAQLSMYAADMLRWARNARVLPSIVKRELSDGRT